MNREVHVRIWERPEVRVLRAVPRVLARGLALYALAQRNTLASRLPEDIEDITPFPQRPTSTRPTPSSRPPHRRAQPRPSRSRQASPSRRKSLGTRRRSESRSDPGATLRCLNCREHPYLARYQKTKRFHHVPDPTDIGYNCDPLARRNMLDPDVEIVPRSTRKSRIELVVEPNLVVSFK